MYQSHMGGREKSKYQAKQEVKIPGPEAEFPGPPLPPAPNLGWLPIAPFFLQAMSPILERAQSCSDGAAGPDLTSPQHVHAGGHPWEPIPEPPLDKDGHQLQ